MFINRLRSLILLSLLIINPMLGEGFIAGTLVRTPHNHTPIEQLKENDLVSTYDFKNNVLVNKEITKITKNKVNKIIQLIIKGQVIEVAADHKFFCPMAETSLFKNQWTKAENLKPNQFILSNAKELIKIDNILEIKKEDYVYCISIKNNPNFFVSEKDILVHNFVIMPAIYAFGTYLAATYEIEITVSFLGMLAYGIGSKMQNGKVKTVGKIAMASGATSKAIELMAGTKEDKLPKKGDHPFKPKKQKGGEIPRTKTGGYVADNGDIWNWDPIKDEWDVVDKDGKGHWNVNPDGVETHPGTHPDSGSGTSKSKR